MILDAVNKLLLPGSLMGDLFYAVLALLLAWLLGRAVRLAVHRAVENRRAGSMDATAVRFLGQLAQIAVYVFVFVSYAHLIPGLQHLGTAWLTSVGVVSVVVGMAAQNTLGNLIAGISLVLYRPFNSGDNLQVSVPGGTEVGSVESINLGYTVLRTDDGRRLVIPNSVMASQTCINLSINTQPASGQISMVLDHDADVDKARAVFLKLAAQHTTAVGTPECHVTGISAAGVTLTLSVSCKDSRSLPNMRFDLLEAAKKGFDAAGVKIHRCECCSAARK